MKRNNKYCNRRIFVSGVLVLAIAALLALVWGISQAVVPAVVDPLPPISSSQPDPSPVPTPTPEPTPTTTVLRFSATGDNLIHNGIYEQAQRRAQSAGKDGYDFTYAYENVKPFYSQFDINWLNQETLVNDELEPSTYPCFSSPGDLGWATYDVGFRVFSLSNNHSYDRGAKGISATRAFWAAMPEDVYTCGFYADADDYNNITIQEKDGITIAYLAYTEHTNGLNQPQNAEANIIYLNQLDVVEQQIKLAAEMADLVVVSAHWGVEGSHNVVDNQRNLAQWMADWGADVIIGTHPHVVQDAQWLECADGRNAFVAYSLGNFLNAQSTPNTMIGAVLTFNIEKTVQLDGTADTCITQPLLYPVINHYDSNYSNIRVYMLPDYTAELANAHGVRGKYPEFSDAYIENVLKNSISAEFLALPNTTA